MFFGKKEEKEFQTTANTVLAVNGGTVARQLTKEEAQKERDEDRLARGVKKCKQCHNWMDPKGENHVSYSGTMMHHHCIPLTVSNEDPEICWMCVYENEKAEKLKKDAERSKQFRFRERTPEEDRTLAFLVSHSWNGLLNSSHTSYSLAVEHALSLEYEMHKALTFMKGE